MERPPASPEGTLAGGALLVSADPSHARFSNVEDAHR
jgi:hypothetical protein